MWKIQKLDLQLFEGFAARVYEFLDIEPLMPPGRLRFSKLLGRPMMDTLQCNCTGVANIDELRHMDCRVHGGSAFYLFRSTVPTSYRPWMGHVRDAPNLVGVRIISDEDADWGEAWYRRYNALWPEIADGEYGIVHPALENLTAIHDDFEVEWSAAADEAEYEEPTTTRVFGACPVCEGGLIGDIVEVIEVDGYLHETGRRMP